MGRTGMSQEELRRIEILAQVCSGQLRLRDAERLLRVSYRQAKRLWKRYREEGPGGLKHRSAGRVSNRGYSCAFRKRVLTLVQEKYGGDAGERFGPTLAAEHLASEDRLDVHAETLRRWMLNAGLWSRERKRRKHRQRRERKEHFGELVQMDGSFHRWLEGRGPEGCLIDMADDASNTTYAELSEQETIWAAADGLRAWIEQHGVPLALYVDWKNLYKRAATVKEQLRGEEPVTQFGRMCAKLGIELIAASSPQAKGRIERMHGTHQDRLVKKLRRRGIVSHEAANVYLRNEYVPEHNARFARRPARPEDYHRRAPGRGELDRIFRLERERVVSQDGVVRYANRYFQLAENSGVSAQSKVLVCEGRTGNLWIEYRGQGLRWKEIEAPVKPAAASGHRVRVAAPKPKWVPPQNHAWREAVRRAVQKKAVRAERARSFLALPSASP